MRCTHVVVVAAIAVCAAALTGCGSHDPELSDAAAESTMSPYTPGAAVQQGLAAAAEASEAASSSASAAASAAAASSSASASSVAAAQPTAATVTPWSPYTNPDRTAPGTVLQLGRVGNVGDWQVAVTSVQLNGNEIVASANPYNDRPQGQYIVADINVTYQGARQGMPAAELHAVFLGTDHLYYQDYECSQVLPHNSIDLHQMAKGGSGSYQVCMDVPPAAIPGGRLFVQPAGADDGVYWDYE